MGGRNRQGGRKTSAAQACVSNSYSGINVTLKDQSCSDKLKAVDIREETGSEEIQ